jgi:hypothetical protein
MRLPHEIVTKEDLIDILFRIARNERVSPAKRIESATMIARLKGFRGYHNIINRPIKESVSPEPESQPAPVHDLLGLNK